MAMTAGVAVRWSSDAVGIAVTNILAQVTAPTLNLQSQFDNAVPFEESERLADTWTLRRCALGQNQPESSRRANANPDQYHALSRR